MNYRTFNIVWFGIWFVGVSLPLTYAMSLHALPLPTRDAAKSIETTDGRWTITHLLAGGCPCSKAVAAHLAGRAPLAGVNEHVLVIGVDKAMRDTLESRGFNVTSADAEQVQKEFGVTGGPWLIIAGTDGKFVYSGGYAPSRIVRPDQPQELSILARLQSGQTVDRYPTFGCATSRWAKCVSDPLGIKY